MIGWIDCDSAWYEADVWCVVCERVGFGATGKPALPTTGQLAKA